MAKCRMCESINNEKRNIQVATLEFEDGQLKDDEVEYDVYCKDCGSYIGNFSWGYWSEN